MKKEKDEQRITTTVPWFSWQKGIPPTKPRANTGCEY